MGERKIFIVGASTLAAILHEEFIVSQGEDFGGFVADDPAKHESRSFNGHPIVSFEYLRSEIYSKIELLMGVGYSGLNGHRKRLFEALSADGFNFGTRIHPTAYVSNSASVGQGSIIMAGSVVEPGAIVRDNSFIGSNCTVAHDSEIGSHCWLASGSVIAGNCSIGDRTFVGVKSAITDNVRVGAKSFLGAGAIIARDTAEGSVWLSRGAEKIRFSSEEYVRVKGI